MSEVYQYKMGSICSMCCSEHEGKFREMPTMSQNYLFVPLSSPTKLNKFISQSIFKLLKHQASYDSINRRVKANYTREIDKSVIRNIFLDLLDIRVPESLKTPSPGDQCVKEAPDYVFLSEKSNNQLQRILNSLLNKHPKIEFFQDILSFASLLLIAMSPNEVFAVLDKLVSSLDHFAITYSNLQNHTDFICKYLNTKTPHLTSKFPKNQLEPFIKSLFSTFLSDYFNFGQSFLFLIPYLAMGEEFPIKLTLSIFLTISLELYLPDPIISESLIQQVCYQYPAQIIDNMKKISLCSHHSPIKEERYPGSVSLILSDEEMQFLWTSLDPCFQMRNPYLIFSSKSQGMCLRTLLQAASHYPESAPVILILKTSDRSVIGVMLDCNLNQCSKYIGGSSSFLFQLRPNLSIWRSTGANSMYALVSPERLLFGGGGCGPGLLLDRDLLHCLCFPCETFSNTPSEFDYLVSDCEAILLAY